jgi:hypothetical protein
MAITVDVTGFYFSETVPFNNQITVQEVMEQVAVKTQGRETEFNFAPRAGQPGKWLNSITVEFKCDLPRSRQVDPNTGIGIEKADKFFHYDDSVGSLMGPTDKEQAQFALVWQYYVTDKFGVLKNGTPQGGGFRTVVPFVEPSSGFTFADGDTITWRLVAIFSKNATGPAMVGKYPATS